MKFAVHATGTTETLLGVCCLDDEAFAVGTRGTILRWDGSAWSAEESGTQEDLYAVAAGPEGVVAVGGNLHIGGDSLILHRRDGRWTAEPSGMQHILLTVAHGGLGWFTAGYNGGILCGHPGAWSRADVVHYSHVFAVLVGESHAFAAGLTGTVIEFDGSSWKTHDTGTTAHLRGLGAFGEREILGVGLSGTIVHYDGSQWSPMATPTRSHLEAVWVAEADDAYAVGYAGTVLRFDGTRWAALDQQKALVAAMAKEAYEAEAGRISSPAQNSGSTDAADRRHREPDQAGRSAAKAAIDVLSSANFHAVHGNATEVIAVGGSSAALHFER